MPEIVAHREAADEGLEAVVPVFGPLVRPLLLMKLADDGKALDFGGGHRAHLNSHEGVRHPVNRISVLHSNTIPAGIKQTTHTRFITYTNERAKGWARLWLLSALAARRLCFFGGRVCRRFGDHHL